MFKKKYNPINNKKLLFYFFKKWIIILYFFIGWFIILPITFFLRLLTTQKYIIFIARKNGLFLDNVKYLFNYFNRNKDIITEKNMDFIFITENKKIFSILKKKDLPVVFYPSFQAFKVMFATKILIVDHVSWDTNFKYFILFYVKKIQLWHGVGFKHIELLNKKDIRFKNTISIIKTKFLGKYPSYDVVISTSEFYAEKVFSKAFNTKEIWITGYPRNDIFFRILDESDLLFIDKKSYKFTKFLKQKKYKLILYAPTFRDTGSDVFSDNILNIKKLNTLLREIKCILIIKLHPARNFNYLFFENYENIIFYDNSKDIYPLLKDIDCLITDYSSIYMDYLLLDRPIIFFPYDFKKYIIKNRTLQFDYNWITPGKKVYTQAELEEELTNILVKKIDIYSERRREIKNLAFKYQDGLASKRILHKILSSL